MGICLWLQEATILIVVYGVVTTESDLLESFRPKENNPPELNEFLANVLDHKDDFTFVKHEARKYQKMKKDIRYMDLYDTLDSSVDNYNDFFNKYKIQGKRNIHHASANRKFRNPGFLLPNMAHNRPHNKAGVRVKKHVKESEGGKLEKRVPEIIMLREQEDTVQKRMPGAIAMQPAEEKSGEKHLPSQIFIEDEGEKIEKRTPNEIVVESEGEKGKLNVDVTIPPKQKKQAMDFGNAMHRTYKVDQKHRINEIGNTRQGDFYYVDLQDAAEKDKERYNDKRRYGWSPHNQGFYYRPYGRTYHRPTMGGRPSDRDYPQYEMGGPRHSLNDEVAFEKALSYEIEPKHQDQYSSFNNPSGNNLYSVDEGRPDTFQPFYPQGPYQGRMQAMSRYNNYPPQEPEAITNEKFFINNDDSMKKQETSTESTSTSSTTGQTNDVKNDKKTMKHVGNGFIEITKSRRDSDDENDESNILSKKSLESANTDETDSDRKTPFSQETGKNKEESSVLAKHSLHPLRIKDTSPEENEESILDAQEDEDTEESREKRSLTTSNKEHFQSRKLKFNDDYMTNFYDQNENYEDIPSRPKRDFLDALGMKNEEDYSEDNPYKDDLNMNNTDVHNDTHIHSSTSTYSSTVKNNITIAHQKEDVKNIKKILEEPKEPKESKESKESKETTSTTTCSTNVEEKRSKKSLGTEDFDGLPESNEIRIIRETNKDIETKILKNKEKIYNVHEDDKTRHYNNNQVQVRQQRQEAISKWPEENQKTDILKKKSVQSSHKINKKENYECPESTTTEVGLEKCTETTTTDNSNYEQIAHQMDIENEKLAQVVNGHLASKIVSTVFDELKKKSALKTKFYSGLSRKHVNYAGTIDFDIFKTNETEDVDEARLLLGQITKVLNRLVLNQVRRKLCQRLPDELKDYLDVLLNVKNALETTNFVPNTQQGNFLFQYQEKNEPPFNMQKLQATLVDLESLLLSYHNMNEECQNRAVPVKDYIEKHVQMLKQIVNCPSHNCDDKLSETKRDTPQGAAILHNVLVQKQLESLGLGKHHGFIPNFDINQIVRNKMRSPWRKDKKRDLQKSTGTKSRQYRKLQLAVDKLREKRENEKKIADLFGGKQKKSVKNVEVDYEEPVVYSLG